MDEGDGAPARYRAFISYSHRDAAAGRRLHRRLERYVLPRRLVGRTTPRGAVPRRLSPIFRDREDLPAADSLSKEVRAALADSASLIVVCSPAARRSPWVAREVELFRSLHPDRPVLAALIAGTPADSFPDALLHDDGAQGAREPLAADLQPAGDGPRLGFLKLVAGVVGLGLDELVQRDAQRRLRAVTAVTAAAVAGMLAMTLLTAMAIGARREAERQRAEAEGMVEFMLTDLRDTLEGVGRLDALDAVNARAIRYYEAQDIGRLPPDSLERRARVMLAIGTELQTRGDLDGAMQRFEEARRTTAALLAADPDNPDRIWAHGQSEFALGSLAFDRQQYGPARTAFEAYRDLSERLVAREPKNARYLREAGFAQGNLCSLGVAQRSQPGATLVACRAALARMEAAAAAAPQPAGYALDLANRHAWLADAWRLNGDDGEAREHRLAEETILRRLTAADPANMEVRLRWVGLHRAVAGLEFTGGRADLARQRLQSALETADAMVAHEPANERWAALRRKTADDLVALERLQKERLQ
ncbi:toll/interleukin-1 receptor domain-containing protein [Brevundimonas sp.]|uniref:toll/interleukin-1 receptor domain-containing protein n=1 Tax=Brevundimonas sp. TaxID=1871086 RepID=UPI002D26B0C9|nr:toll/interleukin-1 receptor domain-containing protein [Brevundimonas sp.]HYD26328.1 toll/interleukin-1 receptor domain-containing protein [Brevundimonas sp.]